MSGPYLVGVDCGTQSAKVVIFDSVGTAVASGRQALRPMSRPAPGIAVHPDDDIWDSIAAACQRAMADFTTRFRGDPRDIVAIGLCPIRCCKAFLRADGSLLEPVMSWMDERAYTPYAPEASDLAYVTTLSGYIAHRFTEMFLDSAANNIVDQWPIDPQRWDWSTEATTMAHHGLSRTLLFDLQLPGQVIGRVTPEAAAKTGIPVGIAAVATANDKAVEMLGTGALDDDTVVVSLGTYIAAMMLGSENRMSTDHFWTNFSAVPHRYLYESNGIRRGMWTIRWFLDLLGPELCEHASSLGLSPESYLEREAVMVGAGSDGLRTVLDWLAPAHAPYRKGAFLGFDARHTRGHLYRSILEAIALTMKANVDALCADQSRRWSDIVISGGGSSSDLMMQIFSDVFEARVSRTVNAGGASLGAAMCAAAGVGIYPDIETACTAMSPAREYFAPNTADSQTYRLIGSGVYDQIRQATDLFFQSRDTCRGETAASTD